MESQWGEVFKNLLFSFRNKQTFDFVNCTDEIHIYIYLDQRNELKTIKEILTFVGCDRFGKIMINQTARHKLNIYNECLKKTQKIYSQSIEFFFESLPFSKNSNNLEIRSKCDDALSRYRSTLTQIDRQTVSVQCCPRLFRRRRGHCRCRRCHCCVVQRTL